MELLTSKQVIERERECVSRQQCDRDCGKCDLVMEAPDILAAYDHALDLLSAEEQGLLVRLPCEVGDTVYRPLYGKIWEGMVLNFCFDGTVSASIQNVTGGAIVFERKEDFGKTVFLTRAEAEAALAKEG